MKNIKKMLSVLLAMVMIMSMAGIVAAEENGKYSITIQNSADGHTYEAYQIFTGDVYISAAEEGKPVKKVLSNIEWGSSISAQGKTVLGDAAAYAKAIDVENINGDVFARELAKYLTDPVQTTSTKTADNTYVLSNLTPGYYLVKDKDGSLSGKDDSYTKYILEIVEDSKIAPKSSVPSVQKKVDDINDSNKLEDEVVWNDSADYDINDAVPFQLKATLAGNVNDYLKYKIVFHDTMSKGLTYNEITKVTVNGAEVTEGYTVKTKTNAEGITALTITFENVKDQGAVNNSVVIVEYTAILNENAVHGAMGNPNYVYLEYSNNPNWGWDAWVDKDDDGKWDDGETPKNPNNPGGDEDDDDESSTPGGDNESSGTGSESSTPGGGDSEGDDDSSSTGGDSEGGDDSSSAGGDGGDDDSSSVGGDDEGDDTPDNPNNDETGKTEEDKVIVFTYKVVVNKVDEEEKPLAGAEFTLYKKNNQGEFVSVGTKTAITPEGGNVANQFIWYGLDDGEYKISETKTPDGYNTIGDIGFTITADHDILWEAQGQSEVLNSLTGGDKFTGLVETGSVTAKVINEAGALLPETGGIGTTIFYIVGGLLVFGAVVVLITKKRIKD